jgi:hypothetical protein
MTESVNKYGEVVNPFAGLGQRRSDLIGTREVPARAEILMKEAGVRK